MTTPENSKEHRTQLSFENTEALVDLCGQASSRLKLLERTAKVSVHLRGTELTVVGAEEDVAVAVNALLAYAIGRSSCSSAAPRPLPEASTCIVTGFFLS